ncbi:hypothetical protein MWN33_17710 [Starkeya koreensis]|uniref:Molecular chaperone DnaJ n=1 Tax=Ancylobacter koreensis TaxID=266121 RepID=A0ABT0DRG9_9HYPH|nr:hypothetical protein [Ancylobacter koreensis]MCK0209871.1 hypothetical protein [Ancylobacter koreensis]
MSSRFVRFDPETVELLDRCAARAQQVARQMHPDANDEDTRTRLASALIEALQLGETDEASLVAFALRVLPAAREDAFGRAPATAA